MLVLACYAVAIGSSLGKEDSWLFSTRADYISLWGGGRLAAQGKAAAAYDREEHVRTMSEGLGREVQPFPFAYPPMFLGVMAPFGAMPYIPSRLLWTALTLGLFLWMCAAVTGERLGPLWLGAGVVTLANILVGQNGFLTAALFGGALVLLPHRQILAGVMIGALAYKPHLGLLLPIALAAGGYWRAFAAAAITTLASAALALGVFGSEAWSAFFEGIRQFGADLVTERYMVTAKLQSAYGMLATLGAGKGIAMTLQWVCAIALAVLTYVVWSGRSAFELKAALLAAGVALASPYVFAYDLTVLAVGQGFLIRYWLARGMEAREMIALMAINAAVVLMIQTAMPTGFFGSLILLAAVLREIRASETAACRAPAVPA